MDFPYKTADITRKDFGALRDGTPVGIWYLANRQGMRAEVLDLGGIVNRLVVIGGNLKKHNVVLGARDLAAYEEGTFLAAALREDARVVCPPVMEARQEGRHLVMRYVFEGGPCAGTSVELRFALTEDNEFVVGWEIARVVDASAAEGVAGGEVSGISGPAYGAIGGLMAGGLPVYFNLAGQEPGNVLDHAIAIDAAGYADLTAQGTENKEGSLAGTACGADFGVACTCGGAGEAGDLSLPLRDVAGTPADYRDGKALVDGILPTECLGGEVAGFDYCLLLDKATAEKTGNSAPRIDGLLDAASVYCGRSRVYMDFATDAPAVRLTTFQPRGGVPVEGKSRSPYGNHSGFALGPMTPAGTPLRSGERRSVIAAYRFVTDYPEGYYTDNGCVDKIL